MIHDFPNDYYMDTEFTSGDFCGITDVPFSSNNSITTSNSSIIATESSPTYPLDRGLKPVKGIKREKENEPKYSKWCLGMSWFGLCKSKTASASNVSVRIQFDTTQHCNQYRQSHQIRQHNENEREVGIPNGALECLGLDFAHQKQFSNRFKPVLEQPALQQPL